MQALIDSFLRHCPEDSARAYQHLKSLYTVLDDSVERVKSSMNAVIDRREFDKMDEFQSLLRAIDEGQQNWGFTSNSYVKATNKQTESPTNDQLRFRWL